MGFKSLIAVAALLVAPLTQAAYVTINEAGLDNVYSQARVDIRIGAVTQLVRPDLLDITTDAEISALFAQHVGAQNVVNFYFVDTIDSCSGFNPNIIGCGETPGQDFVVESTWADDNTIPAGGNISFGVQLLAHELGHNLGLGHRSGDFLMNPFINGFKDLNAAEINTILASPLVQTDPLNGQKFVLINPVLVVAAANGVPEPSSIALVLAGLLAAGAGVRKQRKQA